MDTNRRKKFNDIVRYLGWLLIMVHSAALMFAFYCIVNAERLGDNGDSADTAWHAELIRNVMCGLVILIVVSGSFFLIVRMALKRKARHSA